MKREFFVAILRTFLFYSAPSNGILIDSFADLEKLETIGLEFANTISPSTLAMRIFLYGYCCSTWVKASKLLGRRRNCELLEEGCVTQKNRIGLIHLFLGSLIFQISFGSSNYISVGGAGFPGRMLCLLNSRQLPKALRKAFILSLSGLVVDEALTAGCMYWFDKQLKVVGLLPPDSQRKDCMICLQEDSDSVIQICEARHSSHPECIGAWIKKNRNAPCPMCRREMNKVEVVSKRHFGWITSLYSVSTLYKRVFISSTSFCIMTLLFLCQMKWTKWRLVG